MNFLNTLLKTASPNKPKEIFSNKKKNSKTSFEDIFTNVIVASKDEKKYLKNFNKTDSLFKLNNNQEKFILSIKDGVGRGYIDIKEKIIDNANNSLNFKRYKQTKQNLFNKNHNLAQLDDFFKAAIQKKSSFEFKNTILKDKIKNQFVTFYFKTDSDVENKAIVDIAKKLVFIKTNEKKLIDKKNEINKINSKEKDLGSIKKSFKFDSRKKAEQSYLTDKLNNSQLEGFVRLFYQETSLKSTKEMHSNKKNYLKTSSNITDLTLNDRNLEEKGDIFKKEISKKYANALDNISDKKYEISKNQNNTKRESLSGYEYLNKDLKESKKNLTNNDSVNKNLKNINFEHQHETHREILNEKYILEEPKKLATSKEKTPGKNSSKDIFANKIKDKIVSENNTKDKYIANLMSMGKQIEKNDIKEHIFQNEQKASQNNPTFEKSLNNKELFKDSNQNFHTVSNAQLSNGSEREPFNQSQNSNESKNFNSNQTNFDHNVPDKQKNSFLFKVNDVIISATLKNHFLTLSLASKSSILLTNGLENEIKSILKSSGFKDFNLTIKDREKKVYLDSSKNSIQKRDKSKIYVLA